MMSAKTDESSEPAPPPVPRKMSKVVSQWQQGNLRTANYFSNTDYSCFNSLDVFNKEWWIG